MVSVKNKIYFSIVTLFAGLAGFSVALFYFLKDFNYLFLTIIFVVLMFLTLLIGILDKNRW